jgi:hypothetical protein
MRTKVLILITSAFVLTFAVLSRAQKAGDPSTATLSGIVTTNLQTPKGTIRVYLPDDATAGDTISGTVTAEPSGKTDEEKQRNAVELNAYVIEIESQKSPVSGGVIQGIHLAPTIRESNVILLDEKGKRIASARFSVSPGPPAPVTPGFVVAGVGQTGRPVVVYGPFDGDSSNTKAKIGESNARVVAESPRKLVVESPRTPVGPGRIEVTENNSTASGRFRNLKIDLTAPKTSLLKGESTELHVEVNGLQGITQPIPIQLQNQSPSTVSLSGGNTQTITIQPSQVQTGGTFPWTTGLTGTRNGGFTINASVPSGLYAAPNPAPPSTQPSASPAPSVSPTDTVVSRSDNTSMPGGRDQSRIEMVELDLQSSKPTATASPTLIAKDSPEPEVPKLPEPPLRPPSLPGPSPEPTRPPYVPPPVAPSAPGQGPIPGSGTRIIPKPPPSPRPLPSPCACEQVDVKSPDPTKFKVTPGAPIVDPQKNNEQIGFEIEADTGFIDVAMMCKGNPNSDACRASLSLIFDAEFQFTMNGANWVRPGGVPALERATASGAITIKPVGKSAVSEITLEGKCLSVNGGPPECKVAASYGLNRRFQIKYPPELVTAIKNRRANAVINLGDITVKITMSVSVAGCKSNVDGTNNSAGNVLIVRTATIKNPHFP